MSPMSPRLLRPRTGGYPLDSLTPTAAYSMRRMRSAYTGAAVRIRRSNDSAEKDFMPSEIADGSMATWIGSGNDGFIRTWYDQSGNGLDMNQTTSGSQPKIATAVSKFGTGSVLLDGSNDALFAGGGSNFAFGTGDFTLELWVRLTNVKAVDQVFDFRDNADGGGAVPRINVAFVSGQIVWYINNAIRIQGTTTCVANQWYHVAACRSGTSTRLFIDGAQQGSTWTDSTNYTCGANRPTIGENGAGTTASQFFTGYMDEIRITKGRADYTANFTPPTR